MATVERLTDVEAIKRERKVTRILFTKHANVFEKMMRDCTEIEFPLSIQAQYLKVQLFQKQLIESDREIRKLMRDDDEDSLEKEMESEVEYQSKWITLECQYKNSKESKSCDKGSDKRNFKLPKLQFITFDGNLKGWLPFWGQFEKIDKDSGIDLHDKYHYLLQAMKEGSEPRTLVESFTPNAYEDCISQLKCRYAREELLIQVYVRELLGMVNRTENYNIRSLYDKLSAQLRALETLGVTKDKFAAFLLPMVESALPPDFLKVWERAKIENKNTTVELSDLLTFLRREVESEQRIKLAKKTYEKDTAANDLFYFF